jgi:hypothetical protein
MQPVFLHCTNAGDLAIVPARRVLFDGDFGVVDQLAKRRRGRDDASCAGRRGVAQHGFEAPGLAGAAIKHKRRA